MNLRATAWASMAAVCLWLCGVSSAQYGGGKGWPEDPYLIYNAWQLNAIGLNPYDLDGHFKLMANIDLSGYRGTAFNRIGTDPAHLFTGSFDGNGHIISNFTFEAPDTNYVGLFYIGFEARVKNLGLMNVHVVGKSYVGGLASFNNGTIENCYVRGTVSGESIVGGLVGLNGNFGISNSYAIGSVSGLTSVGGLVGRCAYNITNCYAAAGVTGREFTGGLVGNYSSGTIERCLWNVQVSGQPLSAGGGTGKTTQEMMTGATYVGWNKGATVTWTIDEGHEFPRLAWEGMPGVPIPASTIADFLRGAGTSEDPFLIATADELNTIGLFPDAWGKHFKLTADLDLAEYPRTAWNIIGSASKGFTGVFDGGGHTISHLAYDSDTTDYVGFFGCVGYPYYWAYSDPSVGIVRNLGLVDVKIRGRNRVGGLAAQNLGRIVNCYVTGSVSGQNYVGPITGYSGGIVAGNYAMAQTSGAKYVGGLVGDNEGTISNSYSTGMVSGSESVGGLAGTGATTVNSFWDVDSSGQTSSGGGRARTSEQMKRMETYAGWNYGGPTVWTLDEGKDYPRLAWESKPGLPIPTVTLGDLMPGRGIEGDPYLVSTARQLNAVGLFASQWDKHFTLMADIDLSQVAAAEFNIIGVTDVNAFTGVFDGNGHTVSGFRYDADLVKYVGLFGSVGKQGRVANVHVSDVSIVGGSCVGGLAGHIMGKVSGCSVTGSVVGSMDVGGLIGTNEGDATDCHANVTVSGSMAGGLVGANWAGHLADCSAAGQVRGATTGALGGLAGFNVEGGTILQCFSTADVSSTYQGQDVLRPYTGGAWGNTAGVALVRVDGLPTLVGGLVGYNYDDTTKGGIFNCYATGTVHGTAAIGGLVGYNWGTVSQCYAMGPVSGSMLSGGLVGVGFRPVKNSYWDPQATDQVTSAGGEARTADQMKRARTYWGWNDCDRAVWVIDEGRSAPTLAWQNAPGRSLPYLNELLAGAGTADDPYQIATAEDLQAVTCFPCQWDKHFAVMADLDLSSHESPWSRIGLSSSQPFKGTFDGRGHVLSHLVLDAANVNNVGLFGVLATGSVVKDVHLVNCEIAGWNNVGALAGSSQGTISACSASGQVSGAENVGGLIGSAGGQVSECSAAGAVRGQQYIGGLIGLCSAKSLRACYAIATVDANFYAGGLVGDSSGLICDCYARGRVSGTSVVGGLAGNNRGTIQSSYATGRVSGANGTGGLAGSSGSGIIISFWDIETSGLAQSQGGRGRTTQQMKQAETYLGWNTDGRVSWVISEGADYPHLAWEGSEGKQIMPADLTDFLAGRGTLNEPYVIAGADQLNTIGLFPSQWKSHFVLGADLDFSNHAAEELNPIGVSSLAPFDGVFDGGNHEIRNLMISPSIVQPAGLFGYVGSRGRIKDLNLVDVNVVGNSGVGALAGYSAGRIENCTATGEIRGASSVGGLVGTNQGAVSYCRTSVAVVGGDALGGLVGFNNYGGSIAMSSASGEAFATEGPRDALSESAGGLVGYNDDGTIYCCAATVNITGTTTRVGGLLGRNHGTVLYCYARGSITTSNYNYSAGGLVGDNWSGTVSGCYSAGRVAAASNGLGGLIGSGLPESVRDSFWDLQTSGQTRSAGGLGLQTELMQDPQTYIAAGWDFVLAQDGPSDIWAISSEDGYPMLWWQMDPVPALPAFGGGSGTYADPYLITDANTLNQIGHNPRLIDKAFRLSADIDLQGIKTYPLGHPNLPFISVFDGAGHTIRGFTCDADTTDYVGLFRYIGSSGMVRNLGLLDAGVKGRNYVGALAGFSKGIITGCHVSGAVSGTQWVGGLLGQNQGSVTDCYGTALVQGGEAVGGLLGYGRAIRCYAAGPVAGTKSVGGHAGGSAFTDSQPTCFYDTEATGQTQSSGGAGRTTAQMQNIQTFRDAGWDFIGQSDGLNDIWAMPAERGYPLLWWEVEPTPIVPSFAGGSGSPDDPYLITEPAHVAAIWANPRLMDCSFRLTKSIDLTGVSLHPIGEQNYPYNGIFDGGGLTISNLTIDMPAMDYVGLFAAVGRVGHIKDLGVTDAAVSARYYVGALAGLNDGLVSACWSSGVVKGQSIVGGLIGWNRTGNLSRCSSSAVVSSASSSPGQIVGQDLDSESNPRRR